MLAYREGESKASQITYNFLFYCILRSMRDSSIASNSLRYSAVALVAAFAPSEHRGTIHTRFAASAAIPALRFLLFAFRNHPDSRGHAARLDTLPNSARGQSDLQPARPSSRTRWRIAWRCQRLGSSVSGKCVPKFLLPD